MSGRECTCTRATDGLGNSIGYVDPRCAVHGDNAPRVVRRTIWKYALSLTEPTVITLCDPDLLAVGSDPSGVPCVWIDHWIYDPPIEGDTITYVVHGTGHEVGRNESHVGSLSDGPFIWHVYEVTS